MKTPVLDHGYVELVESWGSDQRIIEAARMSTDKGFLGWESSFSYKTLYRFGLDMGVPKELARLVVPVGRYSRMRASANLRNWLAFCTLRMDARAQWEIRQYANVVGGTQPS
jgi:thymidylate synthase (FAD)